MRHRLMTTSRTSFDHPRPRVPRRPLAGLAALACMVAMGVGAAGAEAKVVWKFPGAGNGHGVGMSQWGAYGYAKQGTTYEAILAHYYSGTTIGQTQSRTIRVLLRSGSKFAFGGATSACGETLVSSKTYRAKRRGRGVVLLSPKGARLAKCGALLQTGGSSFSLAGAGSYRGSLEIRSGGKGLKAINAVDLESYVRGVVAKESPASWPIEALKAQAVAARSYALASPIKGGGFDQYADTRSQVYGGIKAETAATNKAVADTALEVVMYGGAVAQTFFFSTSGGHTENNENVFLGGKPQPYLRGVPDPYDGASPHHRWTAKFSQAKIEARLGRLVKGKLRAIKILSTGVSPRVVKARIIGSGGGTVASGPTLKSRLGLKDTWFTVTKVGGKAAASRFRPWAPG
jgi:stage II sporulation protein D